MKKTLVLVLAGPGGNGGGGICAARHLANHGVEVTLCLSQPTRLSDAASFQQKIYASTSGKSVTVPEIGRIKPDFIIDALIGYSLRGKPDEIVSGLIRWANGKTAPILSLDVPSGINATTGEKPGDFIQAEFTLTLGLPKTGLTHEMTGELFLGDIGIPAQVYLKAGITYRSPFDHRFIIPLFQKGQESVD